MKNLRWIVIFMPLTMMLTAIVLSFTNLEAFIRVGNELNAWVLETFDYVFAYGTLCFVITCIWAAFSPISRVRIGGEDATPLLSRWNWFAVTLCTTVAVGILFWATAEPLYHLQTPGGRDYLPGSDEAANFSISSLFMHWSFTPYAIYTVPALTFALVYYNLGKSFSLAGPISILLGREIGNKGAQILDSFALVTVLAGLSASLGTGSLSISGGIGRLMGWGTTPLLLGAICLCIVLCFVFSSLTGLHRGIRALSDLNVKFFFGFALFVFLFSPIIDILKMAAHGLYSFVVEFIPRSLMIGGPETVEWSHDWTIFYWANWLAWAPLTALFLGKISRGYRVREFIFVNFLAPALFAIVWMTIFGGSAIHMDLSEQGVLSQALADNGPESVLYALLNHYPLGIGLAVVILFLSFISYVTAADSTTEAIASLCEERTQNSKPSRQTLYIKIMWGCLIGITAWVMTAYSGLDGIRILSTLGGLPALFIILLLNVCLVLLGTRYLGRLRDAKTHQ